MNNFLKVGLLGIVGLLLMAYFVVRIDRSRWNNEKARSFQVWLPDAQGLDDKAPVLLKGVRVGRVTRLDLSGEGVRLDILVADRVQLREGTRATVSSVGLLGEKQLDLEPGRVEGRLLPPGYVIRGTTAPSLDAVIGTLGEIGGDVKAVTGTVRDAVTDELTEQKVQAILDNLVKMSNELERAVRVNQAEIAGTVQGIRKLSLAAARLAESVNRIAGTHEPAINGGIDDLSGIVKELRATSGNLAEVSQRLVDGEGSLGHWVQSDETSKRLDAAIAAVQSTGERLDASLGGFPQGSVALSVRGDYLIRHQSAKSYVQLDVSPHGTAFGRFQLVARPALEGAPPQSVLGVTLQGGYRWRPVSVRMGLTESRPGLGADLHLFGDRVRLSADAWDFSRAVDWPNARLEAELRPIEYVYVVGGWADPLGAETRSAFVGAGLRFATQPTPPPVAPAAEGEAPGEAP